MNECILCTFPTYEHNRVCRGCKIVHLVEQEFSPLSKDMELELALTAALQRAERAEAALKANR